MKYSAIVLAAGKGSRSRLSYNKVLYPITGRPLLDKSLDLFESDPDCTQIILVCAPGELEDFSHRFAREKVEFACGGKNRQDSVFSGLLQVREAKVMIHDGARPFASPDLLARLKKELKAYPAVVPGIEVVDTIKEIDGNGFCVRTPMRSRLRAIQTPQAFSTALICEALEKAIEEEFPVTDDAMAVEQFKDIRARCVEGEVTNIKITSPEDLRQLEDRL